MYISMTKRLHNLLVFLSQNNNGSVQKLKYYKKPRESKKYKNKLELCNPVIIFKILARVPI